MEDINTTGVIKSSMLEQEANISPEDLDLFKVVDTADEAVKYIEDFYVSHDLSPNF